MGWVGKRTQDLKETQNMCEFIVILGPNTESVLDQYRLLNII